MLEEVTDKAELVKNLEQKESEIAEMKDKLVDNDVALLEAYKQLELKTSEVCTIAQETEKRIREEIKPQLEELAASKDLEINELKLQLTNQEARNEK